MPWDGLDKYKKTFQTSGSDHLLSTFYQESILYNLNGIKKYVIDLKTLPFAKNLETFNFFHVIHYIKSIMFFKS